MAWNITWLVDEILSRYGTDILLDGDRFCAVVDDRVPKFDTERKVFRNMQRLGILEKLHPILQEPAAPTRSGKIDMLLKDEGFSSEWRHIVVEAFSCCVLADYEKEGSVRQENPGAQEDHAQTESWRRISGEQGIAEAQRSIFACLEDGYTVELDLPLALKIFSDPRKEDWEVNDAIRRVTDKLKGAKKHHDNGKTAANNAVNWD